MIPNPGVAECHPVEEGIERRQQRTVGPPVGGEGALVTGVGDGVEVGVDIGAAEGVDRLFRVTDDHQRPVDPGEQLLGDLPLDAIGVLELVD